MMWTVGAIGNRRNAGPGTYVIGTAMAVGARASEVTFDNPTSHPTYFTMNADPDTVLSDDDLSTFVTATLKIVDDGATYEQAFLTFDLEGDARAAYRRPVAEIAFTMTYTLVENSNGQSGEVIFGYEQVQSDASNVDRYPSVIDETRTITRIIRPADLLNDPAYDFAPTEPLRSPAIYTRDELDYMATWSSQWGPGLIPTMNWYLSVADPLNPAGENRTTRVRYHAVTTQWTWVA